jgi:hypothetical protein
MHGIKIFGSLLGVLSLSCTYTLGDFLQQFEVIAQDLKSVLEGATSSLSAGNTSITNTTLHNGTLPQMSALIYGSINPVTVADLKDANRFPYCNIASLNDALLKSSGIFTASICTKMSYQQVEDLIISDRINELQDDCLRSIPLATWSRVSPDLLELELTRHQHVFNLWLGSVPGDDARNQTVSVSAEQRKELETFLPTIIKSQKVRQGLLYDSSSGFDVQICPLISAGDLKDLSELSSLSAKCIESMMSITGDAAKAKCASIPLQLFITSDAISTESISTYRQNTAVASMMEKLLGSVSLDCFKAMNQTLQKFFYQYSVQSMLQNKTGVLKQDAVIWYNSTIQSVINVTSNQNASVSSNASAANITSNNSSAVVNAIVNVTASTATNTSANNTVSTIVNTTQNVPVIPPTSLNTTNSSSANGERQTTTASQSNNATIDIKPLLLAIDNITTNSTSHNTTQQGQVQDRPATDNSTTTATSTGPVSPKTSTNSFKDGPLGMILGLSEGDSESSGTKNLKLNLGIVSNMIWALIPIALWTLI